MPKLTFGDFEPGDIVQLNSGGPRMTVTAKGDNKIRCIWFYGQGAEMHKVNWDDFPPETLTKIEPGSF